MSSAYAETCDFYGLTPNEPFGQRAHKGSECGSVSGPPLTQDVGLLGTRPAIGRARLS